MKVILPAWLRTPDNHWNGVDRGAQLSLLAPHAWFLDAVNDISTGGDLGSSIGPVIVLLVVGLVTGGLGLLRAKRMVFA